MVEHLRAARPAIDIVAQHDQQLVAGRIGGIVGDQPFELEQLGEAAMDVADRIDQRRPFGELDTGPTRRGGIGTAEQAG